MNRETLKALLNHGQISDFAYWILLNDIKEAGLKKKHEQEVLYALKTIKEYINEN